MEQFGLETCRRAPRPEQFGLELTAERLGSKAHVESLTAKRLRGEDSGQALLALDGYPTFLGIYAQEKRSSPKTRESSRIWFS